MLAVFCFLELNCRWLHGCHDSTRLCFAFAAFAAVTTNTKPTKHRPAHEQSEKPNDCHEDTDTKVGLGGQIFIFVVDKADVIFHLNRSIVYICVDWYPLFDGHTCNTNSGDK